MISVQTLIDKASEICGSDAELARRMGIQRQNLGHMRAGRAPISPETIGVLCDIAHIDPHESGRMALEAIVSHPKNASRAEVLRRAFFAGWMGLATLLGALLSPDTSAAAAIKSDRPVRRDFDPRWWRRFAW